MAEQQYYLSMYDQSTKTSQVFLLPNKNHTARAVMEGISTFEKIAKAGWKVKAIRSDLGTEFITKELQMYLQDRGIVHETTAGSTPQQNAAERLHRTLNDNARAMLIHAKLPEKFWGEALRCANYLRNRTLVSLSANGKTPLELLTGAPTPTSHLRVFGCEAWVLIPEAKRSSKFGARSVPGIFIGYQNNSTYRVLVDDKVVTSRNVSFVENKLPVSKHTSDSQPEVVADLLAEPPQFSMESEGSHHESEDDHLISRRAVQPSSAGVPLSQRKSDWPAIENSATTTPAAHRKPASPDSRHQSMMSRDEGATHAAQVTPSPLPDMVYFPVAPTNSAASPANPGANPTSNPARPTASPAANLAPATEAPANPAPANPAMVEGEAPTAISHPYNVRSRGN
eukprot:scaffold379_cov383-Pavlova_lutheri.AAC.8